MQAPSICKLPWFPLKSGAQSSDYITVDFCARELAMKSVRALIIDDSSVMRKIVERALRQAGVELSELREASNGAEALAW